MPNAEILSNLHNQLIDAQLLSRRLARQHEAVLVYLDTLKGPLADVDVIRGLLGASLTP